MKEIRYIHGINEAIREEMERDEDIFLIGEDVGIPGGSFGATRKLYDQFGPERVVDSPISEAGIMGLAAGAASCGLRPIVEIMFMDFMAVCMDGIVNQIAKMRYMFGSQYKMPIVIRTPAGGGVSAGPQHSQCLEAWFAHVPGLKVVMPATPYDVKGLLKSAIRDDNPVIVVENKALHGMKGTVPEEEYLVPIGQADVKREGKDVTVVATSRMVHETLKAADRLAEEGIEIEVVDLMSISPWDKETVFNSIGKTHRLVIAHEAVKSFGIGAEISATVAEEIMDEIDAPIMRVGAPFVPVPFSLEKSYLPAEKDVIDAVKRTLERVF
ncbi:MAG: alpha-ketoacid dehydrogenase subunit beta [Deltaproteobacteria bacterium]|jgi:acetoin:2,6-dichlorophenolindophenol oxidoreductase subunit beta|nr:alpha-ketoacid dehydrogenase subunit beta [Deltaproteobacteria bacterium]MBT4638460.1 alpha-ketoacid dehydrogenase subunit beta [Deltaproteobacteria bacterium]MBT6503920.1 alpha-ketoacid dehydrogenase subunit beta [Deltaproteobacteria bacterium]MBT7154356.1 alpha-ketoacid dehydrogenase subunit beta [Deltaproteobacteria bacterium]MBT7716361.1 alpha-ketoacid dehydrogenase subunit beta [Deltaproteobacteria bacterium]